MPLPDTFVADAPKGFRPDVPAGFQPDPPDPQAAAVGDFRPETGGDATAIERAKNAVIAVPQSFALSVGDSISGVARARDTLVEGEGLAMFSPSPNLAKYKSNQRFRAFEAAMLDPSYSQHLIDARTPEETAKIEKLLGPPGKLEGLQFKDEQSRIYANNLGLEQQKRLETDPLYQYGQEYNQAAKTVYPTDPALDQKIESKFARAVGGTLPTVALSLIPGVGPALATTQYATGQSESGAVEAIEAGHPELASEAALLNLFTGAASEYALGATSKLKSILASPRLAVYFKRFAAAYPKTLGVTEAVVREIAQEGLEQGMGNVIAADVVGYDPNRPWSQGVMEAGGLGGAAVVPYALLGSFGRRGRGAAPASQAGGNESSAALDRVNEQLAANPIRPADPGTPAAGGGLPAETRAPAVGQFVFQQGGNEIVIKAPTENIAKELAFRTSPGAVFVRADLPAAEVAGPKPAAPGLVAPSRELETGAPVSSPPDAANLPSPPAATGATAALPQALAAPAPTETGATAQKMPWEMSEAERSKEGWVGPLHHGNTQKFGSVSSTELGVHFGNADAALNRLEQTGQKSGEVKSYWVKIKNTVELRHDPGEWMPHQVVEALPKDVRAELEASYEYDYKDISNLELKELLKKQGYDGIRYPNAFEGGESFVAFENSQFSKYTPPTSASTGATGQKQVVGSVPETVELNELRITKEQRGLGRLNSERLAELEAKEKDGTLDKPPAATGAKGGTRRSKAVENEPTQSTFLDLLDAAEAKLKGPTRLMEGFTGAPVWLTKEGALAVIRVMRATYLATKNIAAALQSGLVWLRKQNIKGYVEKEAQAFIKRLTKSVTELNSEQAKAIKSQTVAGRTVGTSRPTTIARTGEGTDPNHNVELSRLRESNPVAYRKNAALLTSYPIVARDQPRIAKLVRRINAPLFSAKRALDRSRAELDTLKKEAVEVVASTRQWKKSLVKGKHIAGFLARNRRSDLAVKFKVKQKEIRLLTKRAEVESDKSKDALAALLENRNLITLENADAIYESYINAVQSNLETLVNLFPARLRDLSTLWYDGANLIAQRFGARYRTTLEQASAVLAVFSPQKDWFMNVSLAERMMSIWQDQQDAVWSEAMTEQFIKRSGEPQPRMKKDEGGAKVEMMDKDGNILYQNGAVPVDQGDGTVVWTNWDNAKAAKNLEKARKDLLKLEGKRLRDLTDPRLQARFVRMFSEVNHPISYQKVAPNGEFVGNMTNDTGVDMKIGWGGYGTIEKAIRILQASSADEHAVISEALGSQHKVRSFYNNIVDPQNVSGHVTMDTHAIAALLWLPLSGASLEVTQNFGGAGVQNSGAAGIKGTYAPNAEAYRRAAESLGFLPRELQSITWEAVRMLFTASWKRNRTNVANAREVWQKYLNHALTIEQTRSAIFRIATTSEMHPGGRDLNRAIKDGSGVGEPSWATSMGDGASNIGSLQGADDASGLSSGGRDGRMGSGQRAGDVGGVGGRRGSAAVVRTDTEGRNAGRLESGPGAPMSLAPSDSPTGASVNSPADPDSATAAVQAIVNEEAGDVSVTVNHDATLKHNGQVVEGYVHPVTGQIVLNSAAPTMADPANVRRVVREERAHWQLSFTADGRQALREFIGRITPADRAELQRQGYGRLPGETATDYEARLTNEYIAKQARENTAWWRKLVERIKEWLAKNGLAKLSNAEAARAILRRLNAAKAERQLTRGYLEVGGGMVLVAPWAKIKDVEMSLAAHHGTPHKLSKFSTKFIGTGEGAQVYGWGLYFAENFAVAQDYAKNLGKEVYLDGQPIFAASNKNYLGKSLGSAAMSALLSEHGDVDKAIAQTKRDYPTDSNTVRQLEKVRGRISFKAQGQIYTVELNVELDELLDWGKPLSEQSEKVKAALKLSSVLMQEVKRDTGEDSLGGTIYQKAQFVLSKSSRAGHAIADHKAASEYLASLGIKGIRYLDQGSRGVVTYQQAVRSVKPGGPFEVFRTDTGDRTSGPFNTREDAQSRADQERGHQTYNYVIFNDADITITHENGQPVSAGQLIPNFSLAPVTPVSPSTQTQIAVVESQSGNVNERAPAPTLTTAPELRSKLRDMVGSVSGVIHYYGGAALLRAKRGIDLTASYQAAAVKGQTDALLNELFSSAYNAASGFKLPQWMKVGAWANRTRAFTKRLLHVAARLNATGRNLDGTFKFDDFKVRSGMMTIRAFKDGKHAVGDTFLHIDPKTEITEQFEVGPFVTTPDGRAGHQIFRSMEANTQAELYRTMQESFPELMWLLDMFIDPALASVRKTINGIEIPVFNRFAQATMMAESDPNFTPLTGYTPDVLVSRSLMGAIRGALSFSQGTRSPGRKYKFGTSRESGHVRDLLTGFNVRTFQMLQEKARREWRNAVLKAAKPIPKGVVPAGWVKLETGMEELFQAAKRLRNWTSPLSFRDVTKEVENSGPEEVEADLKAGEKLSQKGDRWFVAAKLFPETEARLSSKGMVDEELDYQKFFGEVFRLRGKQLMLPQPLVNALLKRYVAQKEHGALYKLAAWGVRNSTQLFLVMPKTYVANVLTNDLFALEAGTRYALRGLMSANANDLRFARNLFTGTFTNRFAAFRQGTGFFAGSDYMTAIRETLPDQIFADSTSLADVKVRWGNSALDYLRQGEIGGAALQLIGYGSIDVRAKQRMSYAFLKATAVTNAKRAGLTGNALKAAVDRYLANPPMNDRIQAVEIANFEMLNYADSPQVLNDMSQNDFSRLVLPFPRFGYHYVTKQLKRLSAAKVLIGKVPKGQRADAFADLVTVGLYGAGGGGILALALASALGGDDDDDARQRIGTSTVPVVNADGSVTMRPIDREFVTANRMNISAWARASGIESDRADDFWLRVRNYPVVAAAGVTALAYHDAKKYGAATGARQFASGAADLASDFLSVGAAVKVPFKVLAEWQSMGKPMAAQSLVDPFATGVPLSFYITEQLTDSVIPGSRQADELIAWINPTRPRRTASKLLNYSPGVVESLESSHLTGLITTLARGGESGLPPAGKIDRRTATVPQPSVISPEELWSSLGGFNIKAIPRQEYQRAIQPNK